MRLPILALLLALVLAASRSAPPASSSQSTVPVLSVWPASATVPAGDELTTLFMMDDVPELPGAGGYVLAVTWDPAVLEMVAILDEGYVTGGDLIVLCGFPSIDNEMGIAVLFCSPLPIFAAPGVSASEPVAIARALFRGRQAGTTEVGLDGSYLIDAAGGTVNATAANGVVTVEAAGGGPVSDGVATATKPAPTATVAVATATPTSVPPAANATATATASTNAGAGTFSEIEGPRAGSGSTRSSHTGWWILSLALVGAALFATGIIGFQRWSSTKR